MASKWDRETRLHQKCIRPGVRRGDCGRLRGAASSELWGGQIAPCPRLCNRQWICGPKLALLIVPASAAFGPNWEYNYPLRSCPPLPPRGPSSVVRPQREGADRPGLGGGAAGGCDHAPVPRVGDSFHAGGGRPNPLTLWDPCLRRHSYTGGRFQRVLRGLQYHPCRARGQRGGSPPGSMRLAPRSGPLNTTLLHVGALCSGVALVALATAIALAAHGGPIGICPDLLRRTGSSGISLQSPVYPRVSDDGFGGPRGP